MNKCPMVYESISKFDFISIHYCLMMGFPLWVIEPCPGYHHKKGFRFYPQHLPEYVKALIDKGHISLLRADEINAKEIYGLAADKAVEVVEAVYPEYRKENIDLFNYVADVLKSPITENVFKKVLGENIAEFYSMNILLERIQNVIKQSRIEFSPAMNVYSYRHMQKLLTRCKLDFFDDKNICFSSRAYVLGFSESFKKSMISKGILSIQTIASGLFGKKSFSADSKLEFNYGQAIIGSRQLRGTEKSPDFIIDEKKIHAKDVVYFPLFDLNDDQKKELNKLTDNVYYPPKAGRYYSNFREWRRLLWLSMKGNIFRNYEEINAASSVLFQYYRWRRVMNSISIKNFISHCDFGISHIGRNLALHQAGVKTWYFTDSMNIGANLQKEGFLRRHPYWTYLYYDHFVTWNDFIKNYFGKHPGNIGRSHVVGCLWSEHIDEKHQARERYNKPFQKIDFLGRFIISAFDTTYSINGIASYGEGIAFAEDILKLVNEFKDIYIILKEKKSRDIHKSLDPVNGPRLLDFYDRMDAHPRITVCSNQTDTAEMISVSDMVISFPFTSTTFEALSAKRPAVWHDPMGSYRETPYGKAGGVMTHSYAELKAKVSEIKEMNQEQYCHLLPTDSPLMDPYCDGKAIEKFRTLLCNNDK